MPQSRKRQHHPYQKPSDIPAKQRTKGRIVWATLFGVFGLLIALFTSGGNYFAAFAGLLVGAAIGYVVGKNLEQEVAGK